MYSWLSTRIAAEVLTSLSVWLIASVIQCSLSLRVYFTRLSEIVSVCLCILWFLDKSSKNLQYLLFRLEPFVFLKKLNRNSSSYLPYPWYAPTLLYVLSNFLAVISAPFLSCLLYSVSGVSFIKCVTSKLSFVSWYRFLSCRFRRVSLIKTIDCI